MHNEKQKFIREYLNLSSTLATSIWIYLMTNFSSHKSYMIEVKYNYQPGLYVCKDIASPALPDLK